MKLFNIIIILITWTLFISDVQSKEKSHYIFTKVLNLLKSVFVGSDTQKEVNGTNDKLNITNMTKFGQLDEIDSPTNDDKDEFDPTENLNSENKQGQTKKTKIGKRKNTKQKKFMKKGNKDEKLTKDYKENNYTAENEKSKIKRDYKTNKEGNTKKNKKKTDMGKKENKNVNHTSDEINSPTKDDKDIFYTAENSYLKNKNGEKTNKEERKIKNNEKKTDIKKKGFKDRETFSEELNDFDSSSKDNTKLNYPTKYLYLKDENKGVNHQIDKETSKTSEKVIIKRKKKGHHTKEPPPDKSIEHDSQPKYIDDQNLKEAGMKTINKIEEKPLKKNEETKVASTKNNKNTYQMIQTVHSLPQTNLNNIKSSLFWPFGKNQPNEDPRVCKQVCKIFDCVELRAMDLDPKLLCTKCASNSKCNKNAKYHSDCFPICNKRECNDSIFKGAEIERICGDCAEHIKCHLPGKTSKTESE